MKQDDYQQKLLHGWEEVFRKGQLTMWIMLALADGPKHMTKIKEFIGHATHNGVVVDDQSMYRALRRYYEAEMIDFKTEPSVAGPDLKVYTLTMTGKSVLGQFVSRNITSVFYEPHIKKLIEGVTHEQN